MLTDRELEGVQTLLSSDSTPNAIKQVLKFTLQCHDTSAITNRLEYLESVTRWILDAPQSKLEVMSYMPQACPPIPALIPTEDLTIEPSPEVKGELYKLAIDSGLHLLTPMEAEAMLQGINLGLMEDKTKVGLMIHIISIGQHIRTQQQP